MTTVPQVSIIMTTYNRAGFIMESVESILQQTFHNWELVIVDDGSTDNTKELLSGVTGNRIHFIEAGKIGLGIKLKNIGIERTKGELIAFIDSDDLWAPDKLEKQISAMKAHPDAGFSITGSYNFRKRNEPVEYYYKQKEGLKYDNIFFSFFRSEASILIPTLMFRRQCMSVIQQSVETSPGSDVEFLLDLAVNFKAVILYEPLLYRRLHDNSFSTNNWERGYEEGIHVIQIYRERKALPVELAADALFRLYINYGEDYLKQKNRSKAIHHFLKAWQHKPFSIVPFKKITKALLH